MSLSIALWCALFIAVVQGQQRTLIKKVLSANVPETDFSCEGRPSGYYADVGTGCQIYHFCDGQTHQYSYTCPNNTLFQQRMMVCDHWFMVDCGKSEQAFGANLLIGQKDKPFVGSDELFYQNRFPVNFQNTGKSKLNVLDYQHPNVYSSLPKKQEDKKNSENTLKINQFKKSASSFVTKTAYNGNLNIVTESPPSFNTKTYNSVTGSPFSQKANFITTKSAYTRNFNLITESSPLFQSKTYDVTSGISKANFITTKSTYNRNLYYDVTTSVPTTLKTKSHFITTDSTLFIPNTVKKSTDTYQERIVIKSAESNETDNQRIYGSSQQNIETNILRSVSQKDNPTFSNKPNLTSVNDLSQRNNLENEPSSIIGRSVQEDRRNYDSNVIKLRFDDARRHFFIPSWNTSTVIENSDSVKEYLVDVDENNNQARMRFRNRSITKDTKYCPSYCHPLFIVPGTCHPCVIIK